MNEKIFDAFQVFGANDQSFTRLISCLTDLAANNPPEASLDMAISCNDFNLYKLLFLLSCTPHQRIVTNKETTTACDFANLYYLEPYIPNALLKQFIKDAMESKASVVDPMATEGRELVLHLNQLAERRHDKAESLAIAKELLQMLKMCGQIACSYRQQGNTLGFQYQENGRWLLQDIFCTVLTNCFHDTILQTHYLEIFRFAKEATEHFKTQFQSVDKIYQFAFSLLIKPEAPMVESQSDDVNGSRTSTDENLSATTEIIRQ